MCWGHKKKSKRDQDYSFSMWWGLLLSISCSHQVPVVIESGDNQLKWDSLHWGSGPTPAVKTFHIQPTVGWSGASISLLQTDAFLWRRSDQRRLRETIPQLAAFSPREWWWTRICYWDVGISAQFSLLPLLLLLFTQMGMLRDWLLNYQAKNAIEPCNFIQ